MPGRIPPSRRVLEQFQADPRPVPLSGGQGASWLAGGIVLKPGDGTWQEWLGRTLGGRVFHGVRVPRPVQSRTDGWSVDGWIAKDYIDGTAADLSKPAAWGQVIAVGRSLHDGLADIPRPDLLDTRIDPWAVADRVAWGERDAVFVPGLAELAERLLAVPDPPGRAQVVHGDLTGNVLFCPGSWPVVIDVSPYWRPRSFAEGVVMADAACYHGASRSDLEASGVPMAAIARALLFRLATTNRFAQTGIHVDLGDESRRYERVARLLDV